METSKVRIYFNSREKYLDLDDKEIKVLKDPTFYVNEDEEEIVGSAYVFGPLFRDRYELAMEGISAEQYFEIVRDPKILGEGAKKFQDLHGLSLLKEIRRYLIKTRDPIWFSPAVGKFNVYVHRNQYDLPIDGVILDDDCIFSKSPGRKVVLEMDVQLGPPKAHVVSVKMNKGPIIKLKHGYYNVKTQKLVYEGSYYFSGDEKMKLTEKEKDDVITWIKDYLPKTDVMEKHRKVDIEIGDDKSVKIVLSEPFGTDAKSGKIGKIEAGEILEELYGQLVDGFGENGFIVERGNEEYVIFVE